MHLAVSGTTGYIFNQKVGVYPLKQRKNPAHSVAQNDACLEMAHGGQSPGPELGLQIFYNALIQIVPLSRCWF